MTDITNQNSHNYLDRLIRAAKDNTTDPDDAANDAADGDTTAAGQTPADTNGEQQH